MGSIAPTGTGTWDEASSPAATRIARRFEDAWHASKPDRRPDPGSFLPEGPEATPAAWLALLRADLNLRWDDGRPPRVEQYREVYDNLGPETLVALCYEEFCRREEDGEAPVPNEYDERFPELADRLRRVFDIHELIGGADSTDLHIPETPLAPFPEAGQTIAGFHLVEELGRGSFARVFLARERQLADRPVALKVARTGSNEPRTLARLQHTHIVPVHSYRTDPATDLHLLCMPFFGRVTLSRLLADPAAKAAPTGLELLAALDRLDPSEASDSSARLILAKLPFARAIAWWGARLAEALQHAHDRGVLHRDIKPSNVLVTGDALPMLLDFNLAGESFADRGGIEPESLGGTLAYMSPEHLDAVARREDEQVDRRSDVYSLGVLLFEALTGSRPFPAPSSNSTVPDALRQAAVDRRREPPWLRLDHPEVPAALERVIRRCLEPDPDARFPTAGELALDLQAVADDAPLRSTREPLPVRVVRRVRRSWKKLALVSTVVAGIVALGMSAIRVGDERVKVEADARSFLDAGKKAIRAEEFAIADARFDDVARLTRDRPDLDSLHRDARAYHFLARESGKVRAQVDALSRQAPDLRLRLAGLEGKPEEATARLRKALAPFRVLDDPAWSKDANLTFLDPGRKARLIGFIDELLFLNALNLDPRDSRRGVELCDRALAFAACPGPWQALRARFDESPEAETADNPHSELSARGCFEWGVLRDRQGRSRSAADWLERAIFLESGNAWYHIQAATLYARIGQPNDALGQFGAALALDPDSPRLLLDRAQVHRSLGDWARAKDDEDRAATIKPRP